MFPCPLDLDPIVRVLRLALKKDKENATVRRACAEALVHACAHVAAPASDSMIRALLLILENDKSYWDYCAEALRRISLAHGKVITLSPDGNAASVRAGSLPGPAEKAYDLTSKATTPQESANRRFSKRILGSAARIAIFAFEEFHHDSDEIPNFSA